jgi:hypothetical protein
MRRISAGILILIMICCASCAGHRVDPDVVYKGTHRSYLKVLDQWTRTQKVYKASFDTVFIVSATWSSADFRTAQLGEKARAEMLTPEQIARIRTTDEEEVGRSAVFYVSFYTPKYKYNRLNKDDPGWRLWLSDQDGNRVESAKAVLVRDKRIATREFFPYIDTWSYFYKVVFPIESADGTALNLDDGTVKLHIAGIAGTAEMIWELP